MIKKLFLFICLLVPIDLYSQNLDIKILRSLNSPHELASDNFFKFVTNSSGFLVVELPIGMGVAGLIEHDTRFEQNDTHRNYQDQR